MSVIHFPAGRQAPSTLAQDIMGAHAAAVVGVKLNAPAPSATLGEVAAAMIEAAIYMLPDVPEPRRSQIATEARARLAKLVVTP